MLSALLVLLGFFAGLLGAVTGIGGGVLLTPILALHFGIPIRQAIGTSLVAVHHYLGREFFRPPPAPHH